jgi:hypothetical protein
LAHRCSYPCDRRFHLDREIFFYEGGRFGQRLQAWLYDRWSRKYDEGKRDSQLYDAEMLAQPLLQALTAASVPAAFLLDFAAGAGELIITPWPRGCIPTIVKKCEKPNLDENGMI